MAWVVVRNVFMSSASEGDRKPSYGVRFRISR
jgi:hypothetical protein